MFGKHGNNKSLPVTPRLSPVNVFSNRTLENGKIVAELLDMPETAANEAAYNIVLTVDGQPYATSGFGYESIDNAGFASWRFELDHRLFNRELEVSVTYCGQTLTESLTDGRRQQRPASTLAR